MITLLEQERNLVDVTIFETSPGRGRVEEGGWPLGRRRKLRRYGVRSSMCVIHSSDL
jgi:hypothetical protein